MPLNALTITTNAGVVGLPFAAALGGKTAGSVLSVKSGSAPGFGIVNGVLSSLSVPYEASAVTVNEYLPATSESRDTTFTIASVRDETGRASANAAAGGTAMQYRRFRTVAADGTVTWNYAYQNASGALSTAAFGGAPTPTPTPTPTGNLTVAAANSNIAAAGGAATEYYLGASRFTHGIFSNAGQMTARAAGQWYWASIQRPNVWGPSFYDPNYTPQINAPQTGGAYLTQDGTGYGATFARLDKALASDANIVIINMPLSNVGQPSILDGSAFSVSSYVAQLQFIVDYLIAGNALLPAARRKFIMVDELWERGSSAGGVWAVGGTGRTQTAAINAAAKTMLDARGIPLIPVRSGVTRTSDSAVFASLIDTAGTYTPNNEPMPGITRTDTSVSAPSQTGDGTHLSNIGGKRYGDIKNALYDNLGLAPKAAAPSPTRAGNLVTNGMFTGTGGTITGTGLSGQVADSFTASRFAGTTSASVVTLSKVSKVPADTVLFGSAALTMQQITIDTTANASGDREGIEIQQTADISGLTSGNYYDAYLIVEVEAWGGWRNIGAIAASPNFTSGTRRSTNMLSAVNSGGSPTGIVSTDTLPMPSEAWTGLLRGHTFQANGTTAQIKAMLGWTKATGNGVIRITGLQFRAAADPTTVEYDESLPATASITSASTYSFPEESTFSIQCTADKLGRWSLGGTDINSAISAAPQFTIDNFGKITPIAGSLDFESPSDANGDNVYQLVVTLTPFDRRITPVTQNLSITITDINDGFSDNFNRADQNLANGTDGWTRVGGADGAITVTSNQARSLVTPETLYLSPQQGDTRRQRVTWNQRSSGSSVGAIIVNAIDFDNWIGVRVSNASTVTMLTKVAGTVATPATWTPWKPAAIAQIWQAQIEDDGTGGDILVVYQDGVKLAVATGSASVTSTLPASRRAGLAARGTSGSTNLADNYNNRVAAPIAGKVGLKALAWDSTGTASTTAAAGAIFVGGIANRKTANSEITLTDIRLGGVVSADQTVFFSDGDVIRSLGAQTTGTWTFILTERLSGAEDRSTTMTVVVS